jgi:hypothetical protein
MGTGGAKPSVYPLAAPHTSHHQTSYEIWGSFKKYSESKWDVQFHKQSKKYPWSGKINKAVWRGTTTSNHIYKESPSFLNNISEILRGKLVQLSILHPTLIDAAFTEFNQEYG